MRLFSPPSSQTQIQPAAVRGEIVQHIVSQYDKHFLVQTKGNVEWAIAETKKYFDKCIESGTITIAEKEQALAVLDQKITPVRTTPPETTTRIQGAGLHDRGEAMAAAFSVLLKSPIVYVPGGSGERLRHNVYCFTKGVALKFSALTSCLDEALSNAGINPETTTVTLRKMEYNHFALEVLRPQSEWKQCNLLYFLPGFEQALKIYKTKPQGDRATHQEFFEAFYRANTHPPSSPPRTRFLLDLQGEVKDADLETGFIAVGKPGSGKSSAIQNLMDNLCLGWRSHQIEVICIDWNAGATLQDYEVFPHLKRQVYTNERCHTPEVIFDLFDQIRAQHHQAVKIIRGAGCNSIIQYNSQNPNNPMPWTVVVVEEWGAFYDFCCSVSDGKAKFDRLINDFQTLWRKWGFILNGVLPYADQRSSLSPSQRQNFGAVAVFESSTDAAEKVLKGQKALGEVGSLAGKGDCVLEQNGRFYRGQCLWLEPQYRRLILEYAKSAFQHRPKTWKELHPEFVFDDEESIDLNAIDVWGSS